MRGPAERGEPTWRRGDGEPQVRGGEPAGRHGRGPAGVLERRGEHGPLSDAEDRARPRVPLAMRGRDRLRGAQIPAALVWQVDAGGLRRTKLGCDLADAIRA